MSAILKNIYRTIFCRGGHGVHSPFVFDLITTVIEERRRYYCYEQLSPVRLQIRQIPHKVTVHSRAMSVRSAFRKYCFTEQEDKLLFRLANRFQPKTMYVEGSGFGLTPLYLTAYSTDSICLVVESEPSVFTIAQEYIKKYATASVVLHDNFDALQDMFDFIVLGDSFKPLTIQSFEHIIPYINDTGIIVIAGINSSPDNRNTWHQICVHPKVTVTIDLVRLGIVFFNPALHQSTYKSVLSHFQ
jgi:predicted O-methyltransferase YrrM